jgi:phosphatidylglycerol---prolipoprotein diacylglyceryl transferase
LPHRRQNGDLAGIFLIAVGATMFLTEFWRDPIGRGALFGGILKAPQFAGIALVLAGGFLLLERKSERVVESVPALDLQAPQIDQSPMHD